MPRGLQCVSLAPWLKLQQGFHFHKRIEEERAGQVLRSTLGCTFGFLETIGLTPTSSSISNYGDNMCTLFSEFLRIVRRVDSKDGDIICKNFIRKRYYIRICAAAELDQRRLFKTIVEEKCKQRSSRVGESEEWRGSVSCCYKERTVPSCWFLSSCYTAGLSC
jgi:hypothetical protein